MWCSTRWRAEPIQPWAWVRGLGAWLCLLLCCVGASAQAHANPLLPGSRLQGEATLRYFGLRVYHAKLWTLADFSANPKSNPPSNPTADQRPDQPLLLELEYLRELKGEQIAERSLKEMQRGKSISPEQAERWLNAMKRFFPDVKAGDRIAGELLPGQGARFWHNLRPTGQLNDADFARSFFGIWLSPSTSEPDMRQALLGVSTPR